MAKNTTDFSQITKNTTDFSNVSKTTTDASTSTKITTDFALNSTFESGSTWDSSTVDWDSATVSWDGADGASPLGDKDSTDFSSSSKNTTDFTDII